MNIVPGTRAALSAVSNNRGVMLVMYNPFIIPVANGILLLGRYYGLLELLECIVISKIPKIIGVKAHN